MSLKHFLDAYKFAFCTTFVKLENLKLSLTRLDWQGMFIFFYGLALVKSYFANFSIIIIFFLQTGLSHFANVSLFYFCSHLSERWKETINGK
jgi:hypothetical protein